LFLSVAQPAIAMKKPEATQDEEDAEDEPATQEAMDEAVCAARLKHAADFDHEHERDSFEAFMSDRMAEDPSDLDAMRVQLEWTVDDDTYDDEQEHASSVVRVSDMAIALIDADAVAAWYGREHDAEDADEEDGVPFKEQRSLLIDALMAKAVAQSTLIDDADDDTRGDRQRAFEETWSLLEAWGDPVSMDDDGFELSVTRERRRNRMATALGMVDDRIATHPQEQPLYELRLELLEELGWGHLASAQRNDLLRRFPDSYQPF
jgi:tripeptidyl-peptidase-2